MTETPIKETVSLLYKIWQRYPDQRLIQLLTNLIPDVGYFTTNEQLLAALANYQARLDGDHAELVR